MTLSIMYKIVKSAAHLHLIPMKIKRKLNMLLHSLPPEDDPYFEVVLLALEGHVQVFAAEVLDLEITPETKAYLQDLDPLVTNVGT